MKINRKALPLYVSGALLLCVSAQAQEASKFTFNAGVGFTQAVGQSGRRLDTGPSLQLGAGVKIKPRFGAVLQFDYNWLGINSTTLNAAGFPGGEVRTWDFTLNPVIHVWPHGPVDAYIIGGGGIYHRTQEFTAPSAATVTAFDPFFGFYAAAIPTTQVLSSYSVMKPGVNFGAGVAFGTRWHAKMYAEARYHRVFLGNDRYTDFIPVTFGVRW
ncbi:MAG: hypothetical protein QOJ99_4365 [Bryobacterales bacterium]|jgi:hypothetical protein|nr:hypothetical protein [Bryobacterales bacterium]